MKDREKCVVCPLCCDEGKRVEMEGRGFFKGAIHDDDRFPGTFVEMHNPVTRKYDLEIFAATNLQVNWKCPACGYRASE